MIFFIIGISIAITCSVAGDFFMKQGAEQVKTPPIESFGGIRGLLNPLRLFKFLSHSRLFPPRLKLGIVLLSFFFGGFVMAMNAAPVTLVVPLMSSTYVLTTLLGRFVLHERVTWLRWTGILIVILGIVILVIFGDSKLGV